MNLRVRDAGQSAAFYCELLGFSEPVAASAHGGVRICGGGNFEVVLTPGLPAGTPLSGIDHFAFSVSSRIDVDAVHERALALGARTTRPRIYDGYYQTFVFDPDGYKLEVLSADAAPSNHRAASVSHTQGAVAGDARAGECAAAGLCGVLSATS